MFTMEFDECCSSAMGWRVSGASGKGRRLADAWLRTGRALGCRTEAVIGVYGSDPVTRRVRRRSVLVASTLLVSASMLAPLAGPGQFGAQVPVPVERAYGQTIEALTFAKVKCTKKQLLLTPKKCRKAPTQVVEVPVVPPVVPVPAVKSQPSLPGYTPGGNPGSYEIRQSEFGEPHWDYCKPFTYQINPAGMSDSFKADMNEALARFAAASGIKFEYAGETNVTPFQTADWYLSVPDNEQTLIIAILDETRVPDLAGQVAGVGGAVWVSGDNSAPRYFTSAVVIDGGSGIPSGFSPRQGGPLLLHELGHVAGLRHAPDMDQVMYATMLPDGPTNYQAGDLAGFARLASYDCFP